MLSPYIIHFLLQCWPSTFPIRYKEAGSKGIISSPLNNYVGYCRLKHLNLSKNQISLVPQLTVVDGHLMAEESSQPNSGCRSKRSSRGTSRRSRDSISKARDKTPTSPLKDFMGDLKLEHIPEVQEDAGTVSNRTANALSPSREMAAEEALTLAQHVEKQAVEGQDPPEANTTEGAQILFLIASCSDLFDQSCNDNTASREETKKQFLSLISFSFSKSCCQHLSSAWCKFLRKLLQLLQVEVGCLFVLPHRRFSHRQSAIRRVEPHRLGDKGPGWHETRQGTKAGHVCQHLCTRQWGACAGYATALPWAKASQPLLQ